MSWKNIPGYIWCLPLTLIAFIYVGLMVMCRQYDWHAVHGNAFVFKTRRGKMLGVVEKVWKGWGGHAMGQVVVIRDDILPRSKTLLTHECEHVDQCLRLGLFQPILYLISMFSLWIIRHGRPYEDCVFEIAARRAAGQEIDYTKKR